MEKLLKQWRGEEVIIRRDEIAAAWIIVAIHSTVLGPGSGGTRLKPYPDMRAALEDAMRLSEGMTLKYAVAGFPRGGAKAVIAVPGDLTAGRRKGLLKRYGSLVRQLGGLFYTGPDVGTSPVDMNTIAETGAPYIFCRTPECGGAGDSGPATALGVFSGIQAVCARLFGDEALEGRSILVQGVGSVGGRLIDLLLAHNARVLFSDVSPPAIRRFRSEPRVSYVDPDAVYDTPCDVFSPCAFGGILNETTIGRLECRAVVGGANNQLAEAADAERLKRRGILYAPDFAVNIGGAMAVIGMEAMGWSRSDADSKVVRVKETLSRVFELSETRNITTDEAARRIAADRLAAAAPDRNRSG